MAARLYDVLIIGGGPAGLSAATSVARQLYTGLVLDSGAYRNAGVEHMHTVPGFDHVSPADFRAKARAGLVARYPSIEFQNATVREVRKRDDGVFEADDEDGVVYRGRKLVLGTGVRDMLEEEVDGYAECWGHSLFHCLFCHGYEERGASSVGVLATGLLSTAEMVHHGSLMAKRLAESVTIYTNGDEALAESTSALVRSTKIHVDARAIKRLQNNPVSSDDNDDNAHPTATIHFADGSSKEEGFLVNHPRVEQRAPFAKQLGLDMGPGGEIAVTGMMNEASVKGCYAAGDAATVVKSVAQAIHMGIFAGTGIAFSRQAELEAADEL